MTLDYNWTAFALSVAMLAAYEVRAFRLARRNPHRLARSANAQTRMHWVAALSAKPGFEIVAVQALRNSLMSATISASTAALAVMGTMSLTGPELVAGLPELASGQSAAALHILLQALLVVLLFASYVCSAMAMRHFGHAGFVMSMPVGSTERETFAPVAVVHVRRAGLLYGWGLRLFLIIAPLAAGIVYPLAMPVVTLLLLVALHFFDQPASSEID